MPRFFVKPEQILGDKIIIEGQDVNHISRVLRMKAGDELTISDGSGKDYYCSIRESSEDSILLDVVNSWSSYAELPLKVTLFQGIPKADKMELIIQKCVELGVYEIVPVAMKRSVSKIDDKKAGRKISRWQSIAESAAKQAGRGLIPTVREPMTYGEALQYAATLDEILVPYENAEGIGASRELIKAVKNCKSVAVFIGPEGGFDDSEIDRALAAGAKTLTLGRRILRTETAGMAIMTLIMFEAEAE